MQSKMICTSAMCVAVPFTIDSCMYIKRYQHIGCCYSIANRGLSTALTVGWCDMSWLTELSACCSTCLPERSQEPWSTHSCSPSTQSRPECRPSPIQDSRHAAARSLLYSLACWPGPSTCRVYESNRHLPYARTDCAEQQHVLLQLAHLIASTQGAPYQRKPQKPQR